jgi:hypothetical protein
MSVIEWAERTLANAGYRVVRAIGGPDRLTFEDEAVIGFVRHCDQPATILTTWIDEQNQFLREYGLALRNNPGKAWNIYSVFLTSTRASADESRRLGQIEEDLVSTRKIAASGVSSPEDIARALAPLLPVRSIALQHDDVIKRMRETLRLGPQTLEGLLNAVKPDDLVRLFMDEK